MAKTIRRKIDCRPIKEQIRVVEGKIRDIEDALGDPDIPPHIKKRLKLELKNLRLLTWVCPFSASSPPRLNSAGA